MLTRSLIILGTALMASTAMAQDITSSVDFTTDKANDFRGLAYGADGKIYVSGHVCNPSAETNPAAHVIVGRFNADGTPDTGFGEDGFAEVDLPGGTIEQSLAVAPLANGDVVAAINATEEDGGISVYLVRFDATGKQVTGDAWGGETGALEVVFGWPNANNDAFPGVENPPQDTAWDLKVDNSSGEEKLIVAGHGSAAEGSGRTDADRYVVRLLAADGSVDASFNGGKPFTYQSAQTFNEGGRRVTLGADGSIMSAGYTNLGEALRNHIILHLNPDGSLDENFGGFVSPQSSAEAVGLAATPGIAIFNPLVADGGFAEGYAAVQLSDGSWVTTGYGGATAEATPSTLGFKTTEAPDLVSFRVKGKELDTTWGSNGSAVVQSEGLTGLKSAEERGRLLVGLPNDRTLHVGYFGGIPSAVVLDSTGKLDTTVSEDGILALPNDTVSAQFFGAAVSPDGKHVALTTNNNAGGARLVVLDLQE